MPSLPARLFTLVAVPVQVAGRLPDLVDSVIQMPEGLDSASRELRHTRQELQEAQHRIERLIELSESAIDEMGAAISQMQEGNVRLENLTPLAETAVADMDEGIDALQRALVRLGELSSAADDVPMIDADTP